MNDVLCRYKRCYSLTTVYCLEDKFFEDFDVINSNE